MYNGSRRVFEGPKNLKSPSKHPIDGFGPCLLQQLLGKVPHPGPHLTIAREWRGRRVGFVPKRGGRDRAKSADLAPLRSSEALWFDSPGKKNRDTGVVDGFNVRMNSVHPQESELTGMAGGFLLVSREKKTLAPRKETAVDLDSKSASRTLEDGHQMGTLSQLFEVRHDFGVDSPKTRGKLIL